MRTDSHDSHARWALVVAHPGHELRLHHWLETMRPVVAVLTDGSGPGDVPRIEHTTRVLEDVGARRGGVYAALTDRQAYATLLDRSVEPWLSLVERLTDDLVGADVTDVVYDGAEGFNPVHDVCNLLGSVAARRAGERLGRPVRAWDFPLEAPPDDCPPELLAGASTCRLDAHAFERKLQAIACYEPLAPEVERAYATHGRRAFAVERLRPARRGSLDHRPGEPPLQYEVYGRQRVASGRYAHVLTHATHVRPLVEALDRRAATRARG
jgi:hypothetical protein